MSLKSTVQSLRNRAEDVRLSQADRDGFIASWRSDVAELYENVRSALLQVLDVDVLGFELDEITVSEEKLGDYQISAMMVTIVDQKIRLEPVARMTIGGTGRVDMYRWDRPSDEKRIFVVRGTIEADHSPSEWLIERKTSKSVEELAARYVVRGYRTYVPMRADSIQQAVDALLVMN